ncbi:ATP-dependent DNA helicase [Streptomyces noursei]|uniref:DEAD/DEAH box helicase n=2 Tax=Streptomyces noursei TaxID=1971 RepID=A0A059WAA2_STRNR|nr:ATP-dependent DNA helicase [Streptomyces noursei]GCB93967.1 DEAD/DEAH box helicase [Streptomyces noursei]
MWPLGGDPAQAATDPRLHSAVEALVDGARAGAVGTLTTERINGTSALTSPYAPVLEAAGFHPTPRGMRLRG